MPTDAPVSSGFVYENIAERIETMIEDGVLRPGERAPSLRQVSRKMGVSLTSVIKAYTILEGQGLLEAHPQSGFYVRDQGRLSTPEPAACTPKLTETVVTKNRLISSFLNSIQDPENRFFACASPDHSLLPTRELGKLVSAVGRDSMETGVEYAFAPGSEPLRREIAKRALDTHCHIHPNDLTITNGCLEALNFCLGVVAKPGDAIAIESPTYMGVLQAIENHNMRAVEIPVHPRTGVDLDVLEDVLKRRLVKACLFIPNFNNPLGCLMPDDHKERLANMLAQYRTPLIEDDIYGELSYCNPRPRPVKSYDREGWVLWCSSFSKSISPGLRVGWVASERYAESIRNLSFMTNVAVSTIPQEVATRFLQGGGFDRHRRRLRRTLQHSACQHADAISALFPTGTKVSRPRGGFVIWVELPREIDVLKLHQEASAAHVGFAPGALFTAGGDFDHHLRISSAHAWSDEVSDALERLAVLVNRAVA